MIARTPERAAAALALLLGLWGLNRQPAFLEDVAAFRALAAAPARPAAPRSGSWRERPGGSPAPALPRAIAVSSLPPAPAPLPAPRRAEPSSGPLVRLRLPRTPQVRLQLPRAPLVSVHLPADLDSPPAYASDAIVPLVYRLGPDAPDADPLLPLPLQNGPFLNLSAPPPPDLPADAAAANAPATAANADRSASPLAAPDPTPAAIAARSFETAAPSTRPPPRLLLGAWVFHRPDGKHGEAPLGGSQSALLLRYRPDPLAERPLMLHARLLAAHDSPSGGRETDNGQTGSRPLFQATQATAGLGWVAVPTLNGTLIAERWVKVGNGSRNAFALRAYGGYGEGWGPTPAGNPWPHWSLYGEAAVVGARRRDLFAAAEARAGYGFALGDDTRLMATAALWTMMQRDDHTRYRLEAGPSLGLDTRIGDLPLHLRLDYRTPLATTNTGSSGLTLTVAAGL
ncbi:hypothetical protein [Pedomonas sp. V897]|uniref:hypothetical protein n=1 Tax=Pedomonas sp. V897 TaxID=3446482 RepID=UPI003EE3BF0F